MQSLLVLGRQPVLGLAELESLYGASHLTPVGPQAVILDIDPCLVDYSRLGGSIKFCKVLTTLQASSYHDVEKFLIKASPEQALKLPEGKMILGLSLIGFSLSSKEINASGARLKRIINKATGRSVRYIPNQSSVLSSAQVIHNKLTGLHGWELVIIRDVQHNQVVIAQTVTVQNIKSYTERDYGRPKRDPKIGMLPPKLAQMIINLATGPLPANLMNSVCEIPAGQTPPIPLINQTILDPFCGTGVILQEALLMGYDVYGTDIQPRMIDYSKFNISEWTIKRHPDIKAKINIEAADATQFKWQPPVDYVASEAYLGPVFNDVPDDSALRQAITDCNTIVKRFLRNIYPQLHDKTRLCLAVPAWQIKPDQFKHLPLIDQLSTLGYNQLSLKHVKTEELVYYRPDQIVARQLLIITKEAQNESR